jgi:xanthine dehydrogenase small subunit
LWRFHLETRIDAPLALLDVNAFAFAFAAAMPGLPEVSRTADGAVAKEPS